MLTPEARQSTGQLVGRIDPQTVPTLRAELASMSRNRRLRAIEAAAAIGVAPALEGPFLKILESDDHLLRAKVAEILRFCDTPAVRQALRQRLLDPNPTVQRAAEETLTELSRNDKAVPSPDPTTDTTDWEAAFFPFPIFEP
jgi:HEAT repeat protein